jgi:hypothetical protein
MIKLNSDEMAVLKLVIDEKDIQPPNDTVLDNFQVAIVWDLIDLGLVKEMEIPEYEEWGVFRPTDAGLKYWETQK